MSERSWTIGSRADCDIRIESPTVSGRHCRLIEREGVLWLEDLASSNGTFVAGERIGSPRIVRRGDPVTLGRNTPLPWPPASVSISIGRLPDNDLVIPLDTVSGHHARLERDGHQVFLVDLGSSNGTSLGDPLNKIGRAAINPSDVIFLGTHRVAAADLLAALPADSPRGTVLEASPPNVLRELAAVTTPIGAASESFTSPLDAWRSAKSWGLGLALSAACIAVVTVARWELRADSNDAQNGPISPRVAALRPLPADQKPAPERRETTSAKPAPPPPVSFDEQLVRKSENGVFLVSVRTDRLIVFTRSTAWAVSANTAVCPTNILNQIESKLTKGDKLDECIVVCNRSQTLRVMSHEPLGGDGSFLSVARLESVPESVCPILRDAASFSPAQGQTLALLVARADHGIEGSDDPKTIGMRLISLKIDQIQRNANQLPIALYCTATEIPGIATAAPVFDAAGRVIGCVESSDKAEVRVILLTSLPDLNRSVSQQPEIVR